MKRLKKLWILMVCCSVFSCTSRSTSQKVTSQTKDDPLITRSVTLTHVPAKEMTHAVAFMLSPQGQIEVTPEPDIETSKTLIITDRRTNVEKIVTVIKATDVNEPTIKSNESRPTNNSLPPRPSDDFVEEVNAPADEAGRRKYVYRVKHSTAKTLRSVLTEMYQKGVYRKGEYPPIFVESDTDMNALLIGATPSQYAEIKALLGKIDTQPMQTILDVLIAEVDISEQEQLGIEHTFLGEGPLSTGAETYSVETEISNRFDSLGLESLDGLNYTVGSTGRFLAFLKALLTENKLKIISQPRILVSNNAEAMINIGIEFPIKETTVGEGNTVAESYEYKDASLILKVTPRINTDGTLRLVINQTVREIDALNFNRTNAPSLNKRVAETTLVIEEGMSVFLGGLLSERQERTEYGIPLLKDLPLLGRLFRYTDTQTKRGELFLLITAHIMWTTEHETVYTRTIRENNQAWFDDENFIETDAQKVKRLLRIRRKK